MYSVSIVPKQEPIGEKYSLLDRPKLSNEALESWLKNSDVSKRP